MYLKNDKLLFIATKYITYILYFVISILVANKLGLYFFGIYGFLKLLIQYFSYSNLGVNYSGLVIMSEQSTLDQKRNKDILTSSLYISAFSFSVIYLFFIVVLNWSFPSLDNKYNVSDYIIYLFFIVIFKQLNQIYINVNRIYNNLRLINWAYIIPCVAELVVLFWSEEGDLLKNILWAMILSNGVVTLLFLYCTKIQIVLKPKVEIFYLLIRRGFKLLLYNISFYFIILVAKSFMSQYFRVEEFAQYSFAYNVSDAVMLLNNSISFLIYPTLLNKLYSTQNNTERTSVLLNMQESYMLVANLIIVVAFIALPFLKFITPEYQYSVDILSVLLLSQLLIANTFALSTNLVQLKQECKLIYIGLLTLILLYLFSLILYDLSKNIIVVTYALCVSIFVYNILLSILNILKLNLSIYSIFKLMNPLYYIPLLAAMITKLFIPHSLSMIVFVSLTVIFLHRKYWRLYKNYAHV